MNQKITEIRQQIDELDNQILALLEQRILLSAQVGVVRGSNHQDEKRESDVKRRLVEQNTSVYLSDSAINAVWNSIFEYSRQAQAVSIDTIKA